VENRSDWKRGQTWGRTTELPVSAERLRAAATSTATVRANVSCTRSRLARSRTKPIKNVEESGTFQAKGDFVRAKNPQNHSETVAVLAFFLAQSGMDEIIYQE
jgi:hypothetical protein